MNKQDWIALAILAVNIAHNYTHTKNTRRALLKIFNTHRAALAKILTDIFSSVEVVQKTPPQTPAEEVLEAEVRG